MKYQLPLSFDDFRDENEEIEYKKILNISVHGLVPPHHTTPNQVYPNGIEKYQQINSWWADRIVTTRMPTSYLLFGGQKRVIKMEKFEESKQI